MNPIPILLIGRTVTTDYLQSINGRTVGNNLLYIQAHRNTIDHFEEAHWTLASNPVPDEIAVVFRYCYFSTTDGLPWSTFPTDIKDVLDGSVMPIFDQMISLSKANSLQMTGVILRESKRITKETKLKICCWLF